MIKYYTRACNFYYGALAKKLIKKNLALPLCGSNSTAFDSLEIYLRKNNFVKSKIINIKQLNTLSKKEKLSVKKDLRRLFQKEEIFSKM